MTNTSEINQESGYLTIKQITQILRSRGFYVSSEEAADMLRKERRADNPIITAKGSRGHPRFKRSEIEEWLKTMIPRFDSQTAREFIMRKSVAE